MEKPKNKQDEQKYENPNPSLKLVDPKGHDETIPNKVVDLGLYKERRRIAQEQKERRERTQQQIILLSRQF